MFDLGAAKWWAIELMHVRADRQPALMSETVSLVEQVAKEPAFHGALIFRSHNKRRVLLLVGMSDHELYHRIVNLRTHLPHKDPGRPERLHDIAESRDGNVYALHGDIAEMRFELGSHDVMGIDVVRCTHDGQKQVVAGIEQLFERQAKPDSGVLSALVAASDDGTRVIAMSRFMDHDAYTAFARTPEARQVLAPGLPEATSEDLDTYRLTYVIEPGGAKAHDPAFPMT